MLKPFPMAGPGETRDHGTHFQPVDSQQTEVSPGPHVRGWNQEPSGPSPCNL